jgi:PAS domain S-box-containing protein
MTVEQVRSEGAATAFEMFFEHSVDALLYGSPGGRILHANPAACEMFRASEEDLIGVGRAGVCDERHPAWQAMLEQRRRSGRARAVVPMSRLDGTSFLADVTSAVYLSPEGEERTCVIVRDVTEQVRHERNRDTYNDVVQALSGGADLETVLAVVARQARMVFDATDTAVVAAAEPPDDVVVAAAEGPAVSALLGRRFPPGSVVRRAMDAREPLLVDSASDVAPFEEGRELRLGPAMVVPIVSGEEVFGVLFIGAAVGSRGGYGSEDLVGAATFAQRAGLAIAVGEARARSERDQRLRAEQLQTALDSRIVIEQAKGVISALRSISPQEAFQRLRAYARGHNEDIHATARAVIDRTLLP